MTYQESDFPQLIRIIKEISSQYKNEALLAKVMEELYRNYQVIPLYPTLLTDTLKKMLKEIKTKDLKKKTWVTFSYKKKVYAGRVQELSRDGISLKEVIEVNKLKQKQFKKKMIKGLIYMNEDQLREDWPMFFFTDKQNE